MKTQSFVRRLFRAAITLAIIVVSALYVNAERKFLDYPVRPAGDYAVKIERAGLTIGVQLVDDLNEQEAYFLTKLTPKGVVPVFIVLQNGSNSGSVLFDKTKVMCGPGSSSSAPEVRSKVGTGLGIASAASVSVVGGLVAMHLVSKASEIQQNILKKEIQSTTIPAGASVHGFLYVPVQKEAPRQKIHLQVPITKADTNETLVYDLEF